MVTFIDRVHRWCDISSFKVALPPKPIAAVFTRIIQTMFDRIHANLCQASTLATPRDTLLPKLLNGELSVAQWRSARVSRTCAKLPARR